ncbi:AAA family ATPase [Patescibacteria group bacterium]|nr:AAA family ATPase [Patescibacteria group bacterium]
MSNVDNAERILRERLLEDNGQWVSRYGSQELGGAAVMAAAFSEFAAQEYDKAIYDEEDAKKMGKALLIMGSGQGIVGAIFGIVGTGKTDFGELLPRVIAGNTPDTHAHIPHTSDVTAAKIVGDSATIEKRTSKNGEVSIEEYMGIVKSLITKDTKSVLFDEINRTNPEALNAVLNFLRDGKIDIFTPEGIRQTDVMDVILAAFNHYGALHTFKFDPAVVSRFALAVRLGKKDPNRMVSTVASKIIHENKVNSQNKDKDIDPVISRPNLHFLRDTLSEIGISKSGRFLIELVTGQINKTFENFNVHMGDPRIARQLMRSVPALALLDGRSEASASNIFDAAELILNKLGAFVEFDPAAGSDSEDSLEFHVYETLGKTAHIFKKVENGR